METLEHSCLFHRSVFCSVVQVIFFKLFLKLLYSDIVTVCSKNREAGQIAPLYALTGNYIA